MYVHSFQPLHPHGSWAMEAAVANSPGVAPATNRRHPHSTNSDLLPLDTNHRHTADSDSPTPDTNHCHLAESNLTPALSLPPATNHSADSDVLVPLTSPPPATSSHHPADYDQPKRYCIQYQGNNSKRWDGKRS